MHRLPPNRRRFLASSLGASAALLLPSAAHAAAAATKPANNVCAFVKFLQSLSYERLAATIAELGFDGIEATVRERGQVLPERVEEDLPKLVEALQKHGLEITVMASSVNRVDQPHTEKVLRTAAALGIKRYRMQAYTYDLRQPVIRQIDQLRPVLKDLVAMNRELGLGCLYQNHSGKKYFGATVWDLYLLIKDYPVDQVGVAFDIRHATVEGGLAWPVHFNLMQPHFGAVYVKDFRWQGRRPENVPLGQGQVDPAFFTMLAKSAYRGPISLHVEYLERAGTAENIAALKQDLGTLRRLLGT